MESQISILDYLPVGFRFRPTDEELVGHYMKHKLQGDEFVVQIIPEVDVCKIEPWDIPKSSVIKSDDPEWFFFSRPDYKYLNSNRANRATKRGFWKVTGRPRYIKTRGTNKVIGTKKTLVFYEGRVPHGVKTNWVIHEYRADTSDVGQRTFVLCRLMRKVGKNAEEETDALIFEEGEPSCHMASDYENQAAEERIPDVYTLPEVNPALPSIQQSPLGILQEASFPNFPFPNALHRNDNSSMQFEFETTEEEDSAEEFVNSIFADEDTVICEERRHAFVNNSVPPESLGMVYLESSDTDAEVVSARYGNIMGTSTVCNEHASSWENRVLEMVKSSHSAVHGSTLPLASNHETNREKKESIFQDEFWGVETSSCDSTADKPWEINGIEVSSSPSTLRRFKTQYHPRPDTLVSQRSAARRSQTQKVSSIAVSHLEAKKDLPIVESEKDQRKAQNTSSRKNLETRSTQPSDVNGKGSFICQETPSSSQSLFPRLVYLVNVVIGILLFIAIIWEVLSCY